ncbi:MAG: phosphatase PAP2 family protein [Fervidicoccaceae archaeon]
MSREEPRAVLGALALGALVAVLTALARAGVYAPIDEMVYELTPRSSSLPLIALSETASIYAAAAYVAAALILARRRSRGRAEALEFALAMLITTALVAALKVAAGVPRPGAEHSEATPLAVLAGHYAFPSGHSSRAAVLAYYAARKRPELRWPLWIYAACVALSRILLGAHWASDVLAGLLVGYWGSKVSELALGERVRGRRGGQPG